MDEKLAKLGVTLMAPAVIAGTVAAWGAIVAAAPYVGAAIVVGVIVSESSK